MNISLKNIFTCISTTIHSLTFIERLPIPGVLYALWEQRVVDRNKVHPCHLGGHHFVAVTTNTNTITIQCNDYCNICVYQVAWEHRGVVNKSGTLGEVSPQGRWHFTKHFPGSAREERHSGQREPHEQRQCTVEVWACWGAVRGAVQLECA